MKKKLFISCPMKGRTEENIKKSMEKMHKMAEIIFDQELEVIPTYIEHIPQKTNNQSIWCLGESIKKLADADFFIGVKYQNYFKGCCIENDVALGYGIRSTFVSMEEIMPDAAEVEKRYYKILEQTNCCIRYSR